MHVPVENMGLPFNSCVTRTGAFDQHGCPLVIFPVDGQAKLSSELSQAEVVEFINYFLYLHKYVDSFIVTCLYVWGSARCTNGWICLSQQ